jgi:hypothetical protein
LEGAPPLMRIFLFFHIQFSISVIWIGSTFTAAIAQRSAGSGEVHDFAPRFTIPAKI